MKPETVYKYKSIAFNKVDYKKAKNIVDSNNRDFDNSNLWQILDIIQEDRLYCSTLEQLNDPFEALHLTIYGNCAAGDSLLSSVGYYLLIRTNILLSIEYYL